MDILSSQEEPDTSDKEIVKAEACVRGGLKKLIKACLWGSLGIRAKRSTHLAGKEAEQQG